jgi:hypothetical protein
MNEMAIEDWASKSFHLDDHRTEIELSAKNYYDKLFDRWDNESKQYFQLKEEELY